MFCGNLAFCDHFYVVVDLNMNINSKNDFPMNYKFQRDICSETNFVSRSSDKESCCTDLLSV